MSAHRFEVPVLLQDLPPPEALHQVFDSLSQLDKVCNDIFASLTARIRDQKSQVQQLCTRVADCKVKVDKVAQNQSKATTVYSSTKYPPPKYLPDFPRIYDSEQPAAVGEIKQTTRALSRAERTAVAQPVNTVDLFTSLTGATFEEADVDYQEGLGRLPSYLPSIGSILLFNSSENPYKKYISLDNLEGVGGQDKEKEVTEMAAAPQTLIEGSILPTFAPPQLVYRPDLGDVPTFDLPENLPLAKLADIRFANVTNQPSIAPSIGIASLPALPSVEDFQSSSKKQPKGSPTSATPTSTGATVLVSAPSAPVPAPPPPPPKPAPAPPALTAVPAPPPHAPAPAAATSSSEGGSGRNALLEAIRNPGVKLRKVTDSKPAEKKAASGGKKKAAAGGAAPAAAPAADPGDMMSALRNILALRRNATSGKGEDGGEAAPPARPAKKAPAAAGSEDAEFHDDDWK